MDSVNVGEDPLPYYFPCNEDKSPAVSSPLTTRMKAEDCKPLVGMYAGQDGLLCFDFEVRSAYDDWLALLEDNGVEYSAATVSTRGGGVHVWVRCKGGAPPGEKLAMNADGSGPHGGLLVETRGSNNQYAIVPPSPGWEYLPFSPAIEELEETEDWRSLVAACRLLDERPVELPEPMREAGKAGTMAGDDYNQRGETFEALLERNGWRRGKSGRNGRSCWTRPGKSKGVSGTLTADGQVFTCFTSSTPLEPGKHYSKFGFLTAWEYGGDFKKSSRFLFQAGYGESKPEAKAEADGLPVVETNGIGLATMTAAALDALRTLNANEPTLFVRSGKLCRVVTDDDGVPAMQFVDGAMLRGMMARAAVWVSTSSKRGQIEVLPPTAVADDIAALPYYDGLPTLKGIASGPIASAKGELALSDGYDPNTGYFVASGREWSPAAKRGEEAAKWLLEEVLCDFPFQSESDRANALALMALPFVRPAIDGPTPLHLADAPMMGTGKSMLVKVCLYPFLGRESAATSAPTDEEEWRKKIMTALMAGWPAMFIDNISRRVDSDSLAMALTSQTWTDRILGSSSSVNLPVRMIWAGTANNVQLSVDLARRSVWIRLDAQVERPWQREGFKHPDLFEWMRENRSEIVANILAMVRCWAQKGRPKWSEKPLGSFENYCRVIGGILESCGVKGYLGNWEQMFESTNSDEESWKGLYLRWWDVHKGAPVKAGDIYELVKEDEMLVSVLGDKGEQSQKIRLGGLLKKRVKRICGGFTVEIDGKTHRSFRFRLVNTVNVGECELPYTREYPGNAPMDTLIGGGENTPQHSHTPIVTSPYGYPLERVEEDAFGKWGYDTEGNAWRMEEGRI